MSNKAIAEPWLLVFDLDGTLIDSSADLCSSLNAALHEVGLLPLSQRQISSFVGDGAASLVRRALSFRLSSAEVELGTALFANCYELFLSHYRVHKLDSTRPYPGILESLRIIRHSMAELPMAVLTNKPVRPSREICDALGLSPFFFANYGGDSFPSKKPAPEGLWTILHEAHARFGHSNKGRVEPIYERAIMIGDSPVDIEVGRACGLTTIGCSYGLAPKALLEAGPDIIIDAPEELPAALGLQAIGTGLPKPGGSSNTA